MDKFTFTKTSRVTEPDLQGSRLGARSSRLDLLSRLAVQAVEALAPEFDGLRRDRIGICLAASAGSLSTDVEYWKGRTLVGGPSPGLFTYTLPSAAIGEIAIRHRLTGPNLCFVGDDPDVLAEGHDMIERGEADACLCVTCNVISGAAAELIQASPAAEARAVLLISNCEKAGI